jgi:hypothetical protein
LIVGILSLGTGDKIVGINVAEIDDNISFGDVVDEIVVALLVGLIPVDMELTVVVRTADFNEGVT